MADILRRETRECDTVARTGGDEFVIIFDGMLDCDLMAALTRRIILALGDDVTVLDEVCRVTASAGTALSTDFPNATLSELMAEADRALYRSKRGGRASVTSAGQSGAGQPIDVPLRQEF